MNSREWKVGDEIYVTQQAIDRAGLPAAYVGKVFTVEGATKDGKILFFNDGWGISAKDCVVPTDLLLALC